MLAYYGPEWESLASRIVGRWCPSFTGNTGLQLPDTMGRNHGTLRNFANNGNDAYVASPDRLALDFDGSNDYVTASGSNQQIRAWSFWVKPTSTVNSSSTLQVVFQTRLGTNLSWYIGFGSATGLLTNEYITVVDTSGGVNYRAGVADGGSLPSADWSYIAVVESGSTHAIYVNGVSKSMVLNATSPGTPIFNALRLGCLDGDGSGPRGFYAGQLDDIAIFNAAPTANEIRFIYEQGRGGGLLYQPPRRRSVAAAIAALVLACETANYSLTGQAAGLFASRLLAADQAQYLLSGNAANMTASRLLSADPASYTATGNDAATICARLLDGGAAAYALTGTDAGLIANRKLTADQAVYFLAGNNAELLRSLKLNAGSMALQLDNFAASLLANRKISADGAQYILVVSDANLTGSASGVAPYYYLFMMRGPQ
jgi:hypothetical protein